MRALLFFLAALWFPAGLAAQTFYKWKDDKGQWVFSQNPPPAGKGAERVDMPNSPPQASTVKNDNCVPFRVGETRTAKESANRGSAVLVEDFQIKLLDQTVTATRLSWSARLRNGGGTATPLSVNVDVSDCQGFKLGGGTRDTTLTARQIATISDTVTLTGSSAATVGRFSLRLGTFESAESASAPNPSPTAVSSEAKAEVVVVSHRIEGSSDGFWLVGRVHNRGRAPARNTKLTYKLRETSGAQLPGGSFYLDSAELAPRTYAAFRERLHQLHTRSRVTATVEAEWQ